MFKRIVVPLDGSELAEQVLPYVLALGKTFNASVALVRSYAVALPATETPLPANYYTDIETTLRTDAEQYVAAQAGKLRNQGVTVTTSVQSGPAAEVIVAEAAKQPNSLIAISTRGRSGITRAVLGSVTDRVIQTAPKPLLVIRPRDHAAQGWPTFSRILVPVDGSPLAEEALARATDLAKALSLPMVVARATPADIDYYRFSGYENPALYERVRKDVDAEAAAYLAKVAGRIRGQGVHDVSEALVHGDAATAIIDVAKAMPGTLIVITTHGRSGIGRWVMGSVTDHVIKYGVSPVLVLRSQNPAAKG